MAMGIFETSYKKLCSRVFMECDLLVSLESVIVWFLKYFLDDIK